MTPAEAAAFLRRYNEWRRTDDRYGMPYPDPREIGEAIDAAVEMIDRLEAAESSVARQWRADAPDRCRRQVRRQKNAGGNEMIDIKELRRLALDGDLAAMQEIILRLEAAEKSDAESLAMYRKARDERDALRAALQHEADCVEAAKAEIKALRAKIAEMEKQRPAAWCATDETGTVVEALGMNQSRRFDTALYLALGAQPAPSVPTALLVAVANLVAQMEIVSRVGFVDPPNDKDSCAAFCVAEGTWLELMSAIESLASALAAAPGAKP